MKPFSRGLAAGVALIACVLLLLAAVPSQTDFDGTYFKTNALPISLVGTLTNWAKINTNAVVSKAGDTMTGTLIAPQIGATLTAGDATFIDFTKGSQTNAVAGAIAIGFATNGVHNVQYTHLRKFQNSSGSDQTLSLPIAAAKVNGWLTNALGNAPVPPAITNNTTVYMLLRCDGPTDTLARQTNVTVVSFEYY